MPEAGMHHETTREWSRVPEGKRRKSGGTGGSGPSEPDARSAHASDEGELAELDARQSNEEVVEEQETVPGTVNESTGETDSQARGRG